MPFVESMRPLAVAMLGLAIHACAADVPPGGNPSDQGLNAVQHAPCATALYGRQIVIPDIAQLRSRVPGEVSQWLESLGQPQRLDAVVHGEIIPTLEQMTNSSFQLVTTSQLSGSCSGGIFLMPANHPHVMASAPAALRARLSELDGATLDSFLIHSDGGSQLWIVAETELGLVQGAFHYLRGLGVRYLLPGDDWTEIPSRADIRVTVSDHVVPEFDHFAFPGGGYRHAVQALDPRTDPTGIAWFRWYRHAGFPHGRRMSCGHTDGTFLISHRAELQADPLTLAEPVAEFCTSTTGGPVQACHVTQDAAGDTHYRSYLPEPRRGNEATQMHLTHHGTIACTDLNAVETYRDPQGVSYCENPHDYASNAGAMRLFSDFVLAELARRVPNQPELAAVSTEPNDGSGHCHCQKCTDLLRHGPYGHWDQDSSLGDRVAHRTNMVARRVAQTYPEMGVCQLAYGHHALPPTIPIDSNVTIAVSAYQFQGSYTGMSAEELLTRWEQKAQRDGFDLSVYDNWCISDFNSNLPACSLDHVVGRMRDWHARGIRVPQGQTAWSIGAHGPQFYVTSRLAWDMSLDEEQLLTEFLQSAFGPAAEPMGRMIRRWNMSSFQLNAYELALAYQDILEADSLATDPRYRDRLEGYKHYLHFMRLMLEWTVAPVGSAARNAVLDQMAEQIWRSWPYGMVEAHRLHDLFVGRNSAAPASLKARWNADDALAAGWAQLQQPVDIDAVIAADAQAYPLVTNYQPRTFSNDLVPLFDDLPSGSEVVSPHYLVSQVFAFYARAGQPVTFAIHARSQTSNLHPHQIQVRNSSGFTIHRGEAPIGPDATNGHRTVFDLGVLPEGLYRVHVQPHQHTGSYWFRVPSDLHFVQEGPYTLTANQPQRVYFYVPEGTEEVFAHGGYLNPLTVYAPDGTSSLATFVAAAASFDTSDQAGVWSMTRNVTGARTGRAFFANVPTVLAFSAQQLLVPSELLQTCDPTDVVPLVANPTGGQEITSAYYSTDQDFAFLARSGRAVSFAVEAHASQAGAAPHEVIVTAPNGTEVQRQFVSVGSGGVFLRTTIDLGVLAAGLYRVRLENSLDRYNMYRLAIPSDLHFVQVGAPSIVANQSARHLYFYVPAGTSQLLLQGTPTIDPTFTSPSGEVIGAPLGSANQRTVKVTDPRGGVWSHNFVSSFAGDPLSVSNVPPYIAFSPEQLLVPACAP